ncbi:phosphoribosylglycinamide formyltransferase [Shimia sp. R10_1]|uniref:phosphoribosylglycinamide formyltransferase n=1 Tax=Shimia sp. R10_1 TaxID=2821095 RepID=UPI001ADC2F6C|nr:phosphoribosylglycinamide formyltransferase [Shimia sp. R10_1]
MKKRVAIFISGGGSNMVRLLEDMAAPGHEAEPVLVLANSADAGGLAKAAAMGVATVSVDHRPFKGDRTAFEAALQAELDKVQPDILCLAGFMRVLTEGFVAPWEGRMLNIHPSLLPKYKGLHTHARALEAGDAEHGCTVHMVTPLLDDGPILGQARVPVLTDDTPDTLAARVLEQEHRLYPAALRRFAAGNTTPFTL